MQRLDGTAGRNHCAYGWVLNPAFSVSSVVSAEWQTASGRLHPSPQAMRSLRRKPSPNPTDAKRQVLLAGRCQRRRVSEGVCLSPIAPSEGHSAAPFSVELCLGAALGCVPPQGATWDNQISWRTPLSASAQYTLLLMQTAAAGLSACAERGSRWRTTSNAPENRRCRRLLRLSGVYTAI